MDGWRCVLFCRNITNVEMMVKWSFLGSLLLLIRSLGSVRFFYFILFYFISRNEFTHILRGCFKLIKRESKYIYNVRKDFYNKSCSIHQRILKYITVPLKKKLWFSTLIQRNVSWVPNRYIRMISEGSCDTEGWSIIQLCHHRNN